MALLGDAVQRRALVYRDVIGLVALDFVLRVVGAGVVRVALPVEVLLVHLGDVPAHVAGFGSGWTLGGGAEFKIGSNWSVKGEYLYADFGSTSVTSTNLNATSIVNRPENVFAPGVAYPTNIFTHSSDLRINNVRFGINYHF